MASHWRDVSSMYQQEYYVPKKSGTLADALLAYGVAVVLQQLLLSSGIARRWGTVHIKDTGSHYLIVLSKPVQREWLEQSTPLSDVAWAIKRKGELPDGVPTLDYNTVWEEISKQRALRDEQR